MMDLRLLQTFRTVVEVGSLLRAADALQYAQSTITVHLQQLEAALGVALFARQGKRMQLTEAGRALYDETAQLFRCVDGLQQRLADLATGLGGYIRMGAIEPTASLRLPPL